VLLSRAALPLSSLTLNYAARITRRHLRAIGSRWRKLSPGKQAMLVLAYLRKGETFAQQWLAWSTCGRTARCSLPGLQ
jgi:hypothetical protein